MKRFFIFFVLLSFLPHAWAISFDEVQNPQTTAGRYVQDSAGVLSSGYAELINKICVSLEARTAAELAVVTIDSLEGHAVEDYAQKLAQKWGIGKKGEKNGLLILLSLKDRKIRLHPGYGLEAIITDATSGRLLDEWAVPHLRNAAYGRALYDLTKAAAQKIAGAKGKTLDLNDPPIWPAEAAAYRPAEETPPVSNLPVAVASAPAHVSIKWLAAFFFLVAILVLLGLVWSTLGVFFYRARAAKEKSLGTAQKDKLPFLIWIGSTFIAFPLAVSAVNTFLTGAFYFLIYVAGVFVLLMFRSFVRARFQKYVGGYRVACPRCRRPMSLLGEKEDDKYLNEGEVAEELAKGMDYEFWRCAPCDYLHRFSVSLGGGSRCPKCQRKSVKSTSSTLESATTSHNGRMSVSYDCLNPPCRYHREEIRIIPCISASTGSSSGSSWGSGGGSFGGGSFGGGGASRSW